MAQRAILKADIDQARRIREMHRRRNEEFQKAFDKVVNFQHRRLKNVKGTLEYRSRETGKEIEAGNQVVYPHQLLMDKLKGVLTRDPKFPLPPRRDPSTASQDSAMSRTYTHHARLVNDDMTPYNKAFQHLLLTRVDVGGRKGVHPSSLSKTLSSLSKTFTSASFRKRAKSTTRDRSTSKSKLDFSEDRDWDCRPYGQIVRPSYDVSASSKGYYRPLT